MPAVWAPDDRIVYECSWDDNWQGRALELGESCHSGTLSVASSAWTNLVLNLGPVFIVGLFTESQLVVYLIP